MTIEERLEKILGFSFLLLLMSLPASAKITGDVNSLKLVSENCAANVEKIKTWSGYADINRSFATQDVCDLNIPSHMKEESRDKARFLIDRNIDSIKWDRVTLEGTVEKQGKVEAKGARHLAGIADVNYDYCIYFNDSGKDSARQPSFMLIRHKSATQHTIGLEAFDPIYILNRQLHYSTLPELLKLYYEKAATIRTEGTVSRKGDIVTLETVSKNMKDGELELGDHVERYVFDLSKGCSLIEYSNVDALHADYWKIEYEKVAGVLVPKKISETFENKWPGRRMASKIEATLTTEMLNEPVEPAEFELDLDKLDLRPGDYINIMGGAKQTRYYWLKGMHSYDEKLEIISTKEELLQKVHDEATPLIITCPVRPADTND